MSGGGVHPQRSSTLPQLEHLLVRAARRRNRRRLGWRRWALVSVAASLVLVAGAVAATGVLELGAGSTDDGAFSIEAKAPPAKGAEGASICLQLSLGGRGPAYGCGDVPTASKPFGLVVADALDGGGQRVVYGLVASQIASVKVRGGGGSQVEAETEARAELPGRFFYVVAPDDGRIELFGYGADGAVLARLGSVGPAAARPLSKAEARRAGDAAGFAPAVPAPDSYTYRGEAIDAATAARRGLACLQERTVFRCFDSEAEAEAESGPLGHARP